MEMWEGETPGEPLILTTSILAREDTRPPQSAFSREPDSPLEGGKGLQACGGCPCTDLLGIPGKDIPWQLKLPPPSKGDFQERLSPQERAGI